MSIADLCRRDVVAVDADATLQQAARALRDHHVGSVVVVIRQDGELRLGGLLTDRDLALAVLADQVDPRSTAGTLTRGGLVSIPETADRTEAAAAMREAGVRRLLVVDDDQCLVGIVSLDDLIAACAGEWTDLAAALKRGIEHETRCTAESSTWTGQPLRVRDELAHRWQQVAQP
jgi:CBS domain-containing protein